MTERNTQENHLARSSPKSDDSPKFGRLLIVLALAVLLVAGITVLSEALYS